MILPCREPTGSWFDFCVRQADRVVVLAQPSAAPPRRAQETLRGCDLLLAGPPPADRLMTALAPRTHAWPDFNTPTSPAVDRLVRRLVGKSVGVVLSGGGARALAHLDVLQVLVERGVIIDRIGGCSMGALVAAMFAAGQTPEQVTDLLRKELVQRNPFRDVTIPRVALLRGRRLGAMLGRLVGATRIEDRPIDFFCVSADLLTADLVVHRRGDVRTALAATMAVPGVTPPISFDGQLLVDGGVLDNLPVVPMVAEAAGPVVAVDVMRQLPVSPGAYDR